MDIDEIAETFDLLDDWEERYRYIIELGRTLPPFPDEARDAAHAVQGCVSRVWLVTRPVDGGRLSFLADSDAHIVRGLVAILVTLFSGKTAGEILSTDAEAVLRRLGLREHLTPQRSNGLTAMVRRIRAEAEAVAA